MNKFKSFFYAKWQTYHTNIFSLSFLNANTFYSIFVLFTCSTSSLMVVSEGFDLFMMNFFLLYFECFSLFSLDSLSVLNTLQIVWMRKKRFFTSNKPKQMVYNCKYSLICRWAKEKQEAIIYQNSIFPEVVQLHLAIGNCQ